MVSKKRLHSGDDSSISDIAGLNGQVTPPSPSSPVFKSPEKLDSSHAVPDAGEETSSSLKSRKKRKATLASLDPPSLTPSDTKRYWSKDEELAILKGIVAFRNSTGVDYLSDSAAFLRYIEDDIDAEASRDQLMGKIRKLKQRFRDNLAKKRRFTNSLDSETFDLSMAIWGKDKAGSVSGNMNKAKRSKSKRYMSSKGRAFVEHKVGTNDEPGNDDGSSAKSDSWEKSAFENVDKTMENEAGRQESDEVEAVTNSEPNNDDGGTKRNSRDNKLPLENVDTSVENDAGRKESEVFGAVTNCELENEDGSAKGNKLPLESVDTSMENEAGRKESDEVVAVTNSEPKNDDGATKGNKLPRENVEKLMEIEDNDDADDELCCLQDALEITMFQHLSNHAQKLMLQNLRNFKAKERKELSDEWKSLLVEEMLLKSKKQSFSAKLIEATLLD